MDGLAERAAKFLDKDGKIQCWPKRGEDKDAVAAYLAAHFQPGRVYSEKEVNAVIHARHSFCDHTLLRRELVERGLMRRSPDCREYRLAERTESDAL